MKTPETEKDMNNVEAWAEVVRDMLRLVPPDHRLAVLALVLREEEKGAAERATAPSGIMAKVFDFDAIDLMKTSPGWRHHGAIERLTSLVIQVFTRAITNNHSARDAA